MSRTKQMKSKKFGAHETLTEFVNDEKNKVSITDTMFIVHSGTHYILFYF